MVAQQVSDNDMVKETATVHKGGLNKRARMYLRRPIISRVFESYVRDLHEMLELWMAGEISDLVLREILHELNDAILALDVNFQLTTHLQRAHIVLLDRVLRDVHNLDDPADTGPELTREQEEEIEDRDIKEREQAAKRKSRE